MPSISSPDSATAQWTCRLYNQPDFTSENVPGRTSGNPSLKWTNSRTTGSNIPGWREKLRRGENATTSLTGHRLSVVVHDGLMRWRNTGASIKSAMLDGVCGIDSLGTVGNPTSNDETRANAEAMGKFAQRILSARAAIQGGVVLGELGQTLRMIRNPAQGLRRQVDDWLDVARNLRNARRIGSLRSHIANIGKNLADLWLEYSFGWKPALADIDDGCRALRRYSAGQAVTTRSVRSKGETRLSATESQSIAGNSIANWRLRTLTVQDCMVLYRGAIRVEARNPHQMDPALFGFSPEQFLPTVWELIPYSFLIDYFVNIDDIIAGWSTLFANLSWSNKTTRRRTVTTRTSDTDRSVSPTSFLSCSPAKVTTTWTYVVREQYNGTYVPDLTFTIPDIGSRKWLNIAALIASRGSDRNWSYD